MVRFVLGLMLLCGCAETAQGREALRAEVQAVCIQGGFRGAEHCRCAVERYGELPGPLLGAALTRHRQGGVLGEAEERTLWATDVRIARECPAPLHGSTATDDGRLLSRSAR